MCPKRAPSLASGPPAPDPFQSLNSESSPSIEPLTFLNSDPLPVIQYAHQTHPSMDHAHQTDHDPGDTVVVPLPQWIADEEAKPLAPSLTLLRKTTVAYGLAALFQHSRAHPRAAPGAPSAVDPADARHFAVRVSRGPTRAAAGGGGGDVVGVDMLAPPRLAVDVAEPAFLRADVDGPGGGAAVVAGRYLEVELRPPPGRRDAAACLAVAFSRSEEDARCRALGRLLRGLFSSPAPSLASAEDLIPKQGLYADAPRQKKRRTRHPSAGLSELGIPASMSLVVQNLIDCADADRPEHAYDSLEDASQDLHLALLDPQRFLFDRAPPPDAGVVPLSFRQHKLYGREREGECKSHALTPVSKVRSLASLGRVRLSSL